MCPLSARCAAAVAALLHALLLPAAALQVTDYISAVNDRFSSGFATNPVANTDTNFVGADFDWSGVGWSATDGTKGFGFISPQHYLVATHYGGAADIRLQQIDGTLATGSQRAVTNTGLGVPLNSTTDLSLATLNAPAADPSQVARYAVLDLNASSTANSTSAYVNQAVYLYGRGPNGSTSPRIGLTTISGVTSSGTNQYFTTLRTEVQLEGGDSGSPAFLAWTNVNGGKELTIIGNNAGINTTNNFINFLGAFQVMNALNVTMTQDGFALRVVGNSSNTWVGSSSTSIGNRGAWGLNAPASAPSDRYVTFNGATAGNNRSVTVDSAANLRGLYFRSTTNSFLGFSFSGGSTLTIGRGGLVNYDIARQTFTANLTLGDHQYWDGGAGGITLSNLNSNGKLLEISGAGTNRITGNMSGSGGLAVSGGRLEVTASNSYTGATWVHGGVLDLGSTAGAGAGSTASVTVGSNATLLISQSNQVNDSATITLSGGTIRTAGGISEAFGNLSVTGSSFLDFGATSYATASSLGFGTYTPGALLTIDNFNFGSTMTFGSDLGSSINNSSFFAFANGGIANSFWNAGTGTFTITAIPEPSTCLVVTGLLGMLLWPLRRKLPGLF